MGWPEISIEDFPPKRDDEPASLRRDIVDELTDHFACAFNRELLKNPDEQLARQRVIIQFGDPVKIARQLWLDAMKEKIMSQRIMTGISVAMAVCCMLVVGIAWVMMKESHVVNHQMLEQLAIIADRPQADSTVVKSLQRTNEAIVRELKILSESQRPSSQPAGMGSGFGAEMEGADGLPGAGGGFGTEPAEPSNINQQILNQLEQLNQKTNQQGRSTTKEMNQISFQLVQDNKSKKPAVGFTGKLTKSGTDGFSLNATSDKKGTLDFGNLPCGRYDLSLKSPWDETTYISRFAVIPGRNYSQTIVCPAAAPEEVPVQFQVNWSEKQKSDELVLICDFRRVYQAGGGRVIYEYESSRKASDVLWRKDHNDLNRHPVEPRGVYLISSNNQVSLCPVDETGKFIDIDPNTLDTKPSINMVEGGPYQLPVIYLITKQDMKKLSQLNSLGTFHVIENGNISVFSYNPLDQMQRFGATSGGGFGGGTKNNPGSLLSTKILVPFKKKNPPKDSDNLFDVISRYKIIDGIQLPELLDYSAAKDQPHVWKIKIPALKINPITTGTEGDISSDWEVFE